MEYADAVDRPPKLKSSESGVIKSWLNLEQTIYSYQCRLLMYK